MKILLGHSLFIDIEKIFCISIKNEDEAEDPKKYVYQVMFKDSPEKIYLNWNLGRNLLDILGEKINSGYIF